MGNSLLSTTVEARVRTRDNTEQEFITQEMHQAPSLGYGQLAHVYAVLRFEGFLNDFFYILRKPSLHLSAIQGLLQKITSCCIRECKLSPLRHYLSIIAIKNH